MFAFTRLNLHFWRLNLQKPREKNQPIRTLSLSKQGFGSSTKTHDKPLKAGVARPCL